MSLFSAVALAPRDPILGLNEQFAADARAHKVNLGVGVYFDEDGKLPLLECVKIAEGAVLRRSESRGYLPIDGLVAYDTAVKNLVFGSQGAVLEEGRVATVQALGGTGGLKIGADFLHRLNPQAQVLISEPSWENHRAIFTQAGFAVGSYRYYDAQRRALDFDGMLADLQAAAPGTIVVLHACCHNPTGYDLDAAQWQQIIACAKARALVPFLDMAYQGFAKGIAADGAVVGAFVAAGLEVFVATSFSKSFSLYGERVGSLSVVAADANGAVRVLSQLKTVIRANYSNPPTHGSAVVAYVLADDALRQLWERELEKMRSRIRSMREQLVQGLEKAGVRQDVGFITAQTGMFSYSGLRQAQMQRLRDEFAVYGTDSGRLCVAALNPRNIAHVCAAIAAVMAGG